MAHLVRSHIAKYTPKTRDFQDRRKLVARATFTYFERDTHIEYRKTYTAPVYTPAEAFHDIAPRIIITL